MTKDQVGALVGLFREERNAIVLTGAGISTESGVPDFRSPGTGLYETIDPMEYLSVRALYVRPTAFWQRFTEVFEPATLAEPNAGHAAVARLEEAGFISTVVTQNIDGLHQKAGSRNVLEVHGHLRTARCFGCANSFPLGAAFEQARAGTLPTCSECGEMLRPDVVLFGDMMPEAFDRAVEAARSAELMLVVGSSLSVSPANTLAFDPTRLAIINRDPTPFDERADLVINAPAGETLTALVNALL